MRLEIKMNKDISKYKETLFFGLTVRQFFCSAAAILMAVGSYLIFLPFLGKELMSWLCILCAMPFAIAGFFHFNGLTLERFLWEWFKTCVLYPRERGWQSTNAYYEALRTEKGNKGKERKCRMKRNSFTRSVKN